VSQGYAITLTLKQKSCMALIVISCKGLQLLLTRKVTRCRRALRLPTNAGKICCCKSGNMLKTLAAMPSSTNLITEANLGSSVMNETLDLRLHEDATITQPCGGKLSSVIGVTQTHVQGGVPNCSSEAFCSTRCQTVTRLHPIFNTSLNASHAR